MGYFRRMLKERFLGVSTTLPSRASHPMAHSNMGPLPSTSFFSRASESSPWVLRAYQMAPAIWPMSSSMVRPILIMVAQLSPDDCEMNSPALVPPEVRAMNSLHLAREVFEKKDRG